MAMTPNGKVLGRKLSSQACLRLIEVDELIQ